MLDEELNDHLGYEKYDSAGKNSENSRNGHGNKTIISDHGKLNIKVSRDVESSFEPQLIPNNKIRFPDFDEKVISLYARGMTNREIQGHLEDLYRMELSPTLISNITDVVINEVKIWHNRPLYQPTFAQVLGKYHPIFCFSQIRKVIYTTNTIKSVRKKILPKAVRPMILFLTR